MFTSEHPQIIIAQNNGFVNSFGIFYQRKPDFHRKKRLISTLLYAESRQKLSLIQKNAKKGTRKNKAGRRRSDISESGGAGEVDKSDRPT